MRPKSLLPAPRPPIATNLHFHSPVTATAGIVEAICRTMHSCLSSRCRGRACSILDRLSASNPPIWKRPPSAIFGLFPLLRGAEHSRSKALNSASLGCKVGPTPAVRRAPRPLSTRRYAGPLRPRHPSPDHLRSPPLWLDRPRSENGYAASRNLTPSVAR